MGTITYDDVETAVTEEIKALGDFAETMVSTAGGGLKTVARKVYGVVLVVLRKTYKTSRMLIEALHGGIEKLFNVTLRSLAAIGSMLSRVALKVARRIAKFVPAVVDKAALAAEQAVEAPEDLMMYAKKKGQTVAKAGKKVAQQGAKTASNVVDFAKDAVDDMWEQMRAFI